MSEEFVGTGDERSPATDDLGQATEESLIERMLESEEAPPPVEKPQQELEIDEEETVESATPETEAEDAEYEEVEETVNESTQDDSEEPEMFTVKIDGEEHSVNLEELKRGYSGQSYINTQMQRVAESRKETEQVFAALSQEKRKFRRHSRCLQTERLHTRPRHLVKSCLTLIQWPIWSNSSSIKRISRRFRRRLGTCNNKPRPIKKRMSRLDRPI